MASRFSIAASGFSQPNRRRSWAIASPQLGRGNVERAVLDHPYYSGGLRYQIDARSTNGDELPLADGGAFDWVAKLTSNRKAVYVASGFGSQLAALLFQRP